MKHQIYTLIFEQFINRNSKLPNSIVVACDKFLGTSQILTGIPYEIRSSSGLKNPNLSVIGIFNDFIIGGEGDDTGVPSVKPVIGKMHYRGMAFGGPMCHGFGLVGW